MRFALGTWFFTTENGFLAWLGVVESIMYNLLQTWISKIYVDWQGRFGDLLGEAKTRGAEALPEAYAELWILAYLILFWITVPQCHKLFKRWYSCLLYTSPSPRDRG